MTLLTELFLFESESSVGYHGTSRPFDRPTSFEMRSMDFGPGFYLATEVEDARSFGPTVYRVGYRMSNPIVVSPQGPDRDLLEKVRKALRVDDGTWHESMKHDHPWIALMELARTLVDMGSLKIPSLAAYFKKLGYDGIRIENSVIVPKWNSFSSTVLGKAQPPRGDFVALFDPSQIVSWDIAGEK